jgi:hypothetical protein
MNTAGINHVLLMGSVAGGPWQIPAARAEPRAQLSPWRLLSWARTGASTPRSCAAKVLRKCVEYYKNVKPYTKGWCHDSDV